MKKRKKNQKQSNWIINLTPNSKSTKKTVQQLIITIIIWANRETLKNPEILDHGKGKKAKKKKEPGNWGGSGKGCVKMSEEERVVGD